MESVGRPSDLGLWEVAERVDALLERARAYERYMRPEAFVAVFNGTMSYGGRPRLAPLHGGCFPRRHARGVGRQGRHESLHF